MAQVLKHLHSNCEALGSNTSTAKNQPNKQQQKEWAALPRVSDFEVLLEFLDMMEVTIPGEKGRIFVHH
jgi:hypothetical protein